MGNTLSFLPGLAVPRATDHTLVQQSKPYIGCTFFDRLPLEVRRQIYKYLLVNPMLSDSKIVFETNPQSDETPKVSYGLSTSILRTSRQGYREASSVLYECNTFYVYCFSLEGSSLGRHMDYVCPLERYHRRNYRNESLLFPLMKEKSAFKVRHWKIILSSSDGGYGMKYDDSLINACRLMNKSRPQSLEILVIPRGMEAMPDDGSYLDINVVLRPLHLLRFPEGRFSIRDASFDEVCDDFHDSRIVPVYVSQLDSTSSHNTLANLIRSQIPVEIGADMYSRLLTYARCFERHPPFKAEMGLQWNEKEEDEMHSLYPRHYHLHITNPFGHQQLLYRNLHPVEEGLAQAKTDTELEDIAAFKEKRAAILEYLEPQYARIMDTSTNIRQFIKKQKHQGGMLWFNEAGCWCCEMDDFWDPYRHHTPDDMAEGLLYLEKYVAAFRRDTPFEVQREIKKQQREFEHYYLATEREQLLVTMNAEFEIQDYEHYDEYFKRIFNHMEAQRMEIIRARKELFKFDLANDRRCEIDPELERSEDLVDWDVLSRYDDVEAEE